MYMKKILKTLLPGLALFLMASCDKYEGPNLLERTPSSLVSTSWVCSVTDSILTTDSEGENMMVDYSINYNLVFKTNNVGLIKTKTVSCLQPSLNHELFVDCTYNYDIPDGVIHYWYMDTRSNMVKEGNYSFVVNGNKLTIDMGSGPLVFDRDF